MCLTLTEKSEIKVAEENIICYKVVRKLHPGVYKSEFFGHLYVRAQLNKMSEDILSITPSCIINDQRTVEKGFHSFTCKEDAYKYKATRGNKSDVPYIVVKYIIPKGSKYIEGTYGEYPNYVSDKIICVQEI